jgi:AcrR family transcriptional regulator
VHSSPSQTLRDRKRASTRALLEEAAVELVLRDGLDGATVDAISDRAFVSPRTFFNYFDSKEDAVLGIVDAEITEDSLSTMPQCPPESDLVSRLTHVLFLTLAPSIGNAKLHEARKEIVTRYPQLLRRQSAQLVRMTEQLSGIARDFMQYDTEFAASTPDASKRQAEVLLMLCGSGLRVAVREWVAERNAGDSTIDDIEQRATSLIREVIVRLQ